MRQHSPPHTMWLSLGLAASLFAHGATSSEGDREVTFIHLNDLHANLMPHTDLVREVGPGGQAITRRENRGGLARIASLIKDIRAESPQSTILMNIGDTYHGGVEALYTRGNAIVVPVAALDIDIGVPGNWDFAYGPIVTRLRYASGSTWLAELVNSIVFGEPVERPGYPMLGGNVTKSLGILFENEPLLPTSKIMTVDKLKVGFIGITSDIVPRMSPMLELGFTFLQGQAAYEGLINSAAAELHESGADLVVVMSELGLHRDFQLANSIAPGVDVFFSAHTHEVTDEPLQSASGAIVVEAGNDGFLGKMTVRVNDSKPTDFSWELIPVTDQVPEDPTVAALVQSAREPFLSLSEAIEYPMPRSSFPLEQPIDTLVANSPTSLDRRGVLSNSFNRFLADELRQFYGTDLALTPGFRFDAVVETGDPISLETLYRYLPVPAMVASGNITGRNLKALFEKELGRVFSRDAFAHNGGWFLGISGVELQIDLIRGEGKRIVSMRRSGAEEEISMSETLSVVSCVRPFDDTGILCSGGGFTDVTILKDNAGSTWTPLQFLRSRLAEASHPPAKATIIDINGGPVWPAAEYIQPLHP